MGAENGLYRSNDAGASWNRVTGAIGGEDVGRLAIGLSADGARVFIGGQRGNNVVLQVSDNGGQNWGAPAETAIPDPNGNDLGNPLSYCESQCGYDNVIAVNPQNSFDFLLGGVGSYRTQDGGQSFLRIGQNNNPDNGNPGPVHVGHHVILHDPNDPQVVYNGNDGGIYRSTNGGTSWTSIGGSLSTLQPYHVSLHPTN
ncbi:MAG: hypothetical protein KDI48_20310, partial [Xanthomonadales bacterium]|nr:hypothetical protein [Xanthomonadales bacterium]